jgi:8-amino-7-oxononanoate synthase
VLWHDGDYLVNHARPFIYATAPSPLAAASVREALQILADGPERRLKLQQMISFANQQIVRHLGIEGSGSQIIPVIIGDSGRTVSVAQQMQADGFDLRAVRPPTVPADSARLRIAITLNVDLSAVARMFDQLARVIGQDRR